MHGDVMHLVTYRRMQARAAARRLGPAARGDGGRARATLLGPHHRARRGEVVAHREHRRDRALGAGSGQPESERRDPAAAPAGFVRARDGPAPAAVLQDVGGLRGGASGGRRRRRCLGAPEVGVELRASSRRTRTGPTSSCSARQLSFDDMVSCSGPLGDDERHDFDPSERTRFGVLRPAVVGGPLVARAGDRPVTTTRRSPPSPFDVCGDLPNGMTLLEASAGTGKTFTIAALTTRYVAEGIPPIDRLLVITFTRMATGELRERVRERLVHAYDGLVDVLDGRSRRPTTRSCSSWRTPRPAEVQERRRDRLAKAIADFDAATIETTHGFCLQVLYGLGTAGDVDRDVTLVEDVTDLMEEVVDDLYLRKFAHRPNDHGFTHDEPSRSPATSSTTPTPWSCRRARARATTWIAVRARFAAALRQGDGTPQAGAQDPHVRRRPAPVARHVARPRPWPDGPPSPARALRRGAGRRVPGHRSGAVGHHAAGVRRRRARRSS